MSGVIVKLNNKINNLSTQIESVITKLDLLTTMTSKFIESGASRGRSTGGSKGKAKGKSKETIASWFLRMYVESPDTFDAWFSTSYTNKCLEKAGVEKAISDAEALIKLLETKKGATFAKPTRLKATAKCIFKYIRSFDVDNKDAKTIDSLKAFREKIENKAKAADSKALGKEEDTDDEA